MGSTILREEFELVLFMLRNNKALDVDNRRAGLIKESGPLMKGRLFKLVKNIYETGNVPSDIEKSVVVPIPKKARS